MQCSRLYKWRLFGRVLDDAWMRHEAAIYSTKAFANSGQPRRENQPRTKFSLLCAHIAQKFGIWILHEPGPACQARITGIGCPWRLLVPANPAHDDPASWSSLMPERRGHSAI